MLTSASVEALENLRNPDLFQWYVIPLLAAAYLIYASEMAKRNWSIVCAGLAFWGMDWLNEIANSVILHATERSALWTAPGDTAYLILVGLNIEICFMFLIAGIALAKLLPKDRTLKIMGLPNRWFIAIANSIFCVFVEVLLNRADALIWEYPFWNFPNVWLIIIFGYLTFHLVAFWVHDMEEIRPKLQALGAIYGLVLTGIIVFGFGLGWL
jgi:hypothetical protein